MEVILRELYGEGFADSPTAALTLKRVKGDPRAMLGLVERHLPFDTTDNQFLEKLGEEQQQPFSVSTGIRGRWSKRLSEKHCSFPTTKKQNEPPPLLYFRTRLAERCQRRDKVRAE